MEPIQIETTQNKIYERLKEAILNAHFKPGETLTIRALAQMLGTSTMPVREAVKRLSAERALEVMPSRAVRLPVLTPERAKEIHELRLVLESLAGRLAAARISAEEITHLARIDSELQECVARQDVRGSLSLNREFHFALYRAARNDSLMPLIESLWLQYSPTLNRAMELVRAPAAMKRLWMPHHRNVIRALKKADADRVEDELRQDLTDVTKVEGFWEVFEQPRQKRARVSGPQATSD